MPSVPTAPISSLLSSPEAKGSAYRKPPLVSITAVETGTVSEATSTADPVGSHWSEPRSSPFKREPVQRS